MTKHNTKGKNDKPKTKSQKLGGFVPIAISSKQSPVKQAKIRHSEDGVFVSHTETMGIIEAADATEASFKEYNVLVNPSVASMFPWLSGMSGLYEKFRIIKMEIQIDSLAATTVPGGLYAYFDYDMDDPVPTSYIQVLNNYKCKRARVYDSLSVKYEKKEESFKTYIIKQGSKALDQLNCPARLYYGCYLTNAGKLAEVKVKYTIELKVPQPIVSSSSSTNPEPVGADTVINITAKQADGSGIKTSTDNPLTLLTLTREYQKVIEKQSTYLQDVYDVLQELHSEVAPVELRDPGTLPGNVGGEVVLELLQPGYYNISVLKAATTWVNNNLSISLHNVSSAAGEVLGWFGSNQSSSTFFSDLQLYLPQSVFDFVNGSYQPIFLNIATSAATGIITALKIKANYSNTINRIVGPEPFVGRFKVRHFNRHGLCINTVAFTDTEHSERECQRKEVQTGFYQSAQNTPIPSHYNGGYFDYGSNHDANKKVQ